MSLRTLERRFLASGSPEHELAWLCQRVRAGHRLEWAAYARMAELAPQEAAAYLGELADQGLVQPPERLGLAACCGHGPARIAMRWATTTGDPQLDLGFLRLWEETSATPALTFELVRAVVAHVLERATARGAWTPVEQQAALEALASCSLEGSWSARTRGQLSRRLARSEARPSRVREATRRAVMCLGSHDLRSGGLDRALDAAEDAARALGGPPRWGDVIARALVEPRPEPREVRSDDGSTRFTCLPGREEALRRLAATELHPTFARFLDGAEPSAGLAQLFGGLHGLFGPPHDVHAPEEESISWCLELHIEPDHARPRSAPLLLRVGEREGRLLLEPRVERPEDPERSPKLGVLTDLLTGVGFLLGFVAAYADTAPLPDFERTWASGKVRGLRYGVRDGVPFDEAPRRRRRRAT